MLDVGKDNFVFRLHIQGERLWSFGLLYEVGLLLFLGLVPMFSCYADNGETQETWVDAEGVYVSTNDLTFAQARQQALENARRSAVEQATGVAVGSLSEVSNFMLKHDLIRVMARGIVLEEHVKQFEIQPQLKDDLYLVRVGIHAKVRTIPSEHRGGFEVAVRLNREVYASGDQAVIHVTPSEDAYVYVFNVTEQDHITMLVPNRLNPMVQVQGGHTFQFPTSNLKERGVRLTTLVPSGKLRTLESIKVIATKRPVQALQRLTASGIFQEFTPDETHMVQDLLQTLVLLDPLEWSEGLASYQVTVPAVYSGDSQALGH
ncbi:MAG: DUF4384 domain-containing protein [Nitrospirales bacterium]|nr:DUF4384 domain-containing protein [Nitrospirales bacterium]